jgi:DNA-binding transcriptional MerR regulator
VAYATKMAAALSGATVSQLRHWRSPRTGPLLAPEIAVKPRAVYSFQDVLALRTFVRLREHASLQKIRGAIGNLRDIGEAGHLAAYRLVSDKRGNIQLVTEDQAVNLGEKPGAAAAGRSHRRGHRAFRGARRRPGTSSPAAAPRLVRRPGDAGRHPGHHGDQSALRRCRRPDA